MLGSVSSLDVKKRLTTSVSTDENEKICDNSKCYSGSKIIYHPRDIIKLREEFCSSATSSISSSLLSSAAMQKNKIVFVPFLGGLHAGHIALLKAAKALGGEVWCTLFLNRLQFQSLKDFDTYPMEEQKDIDILFENKVDVIFKPSMSDMYPTEPQHFPPRVDFDGIESVIGEGKIRHNFFKGIGTVVCKFFSWIRPHYAIFGQKDFQQTVVLRRLVDEFFPYIQVVIHPSVREYDGVAFSSRNACLSLEQRKFAPILYKLLCHIKEIYMKNIIEETSNQNTQKIEHKNNHAILRAEELLHAGRCFASKHNIPLNYLTVNNWYTGVQLDDCEYLQKKGKYCVCASMKSGVDCRLLDNIVLGPNISDINNFNEDDSRAIISSVSSSNRLLLDSFGMRLRYLDKNDIPAVMRLHSDNYFLSDEIQNRTTSVTDLQKMLNEVNKFFIGLYEMPQFRDHGNSTFEKKKNETSKNGDGRSKQEYNLIGCVTGSHANSNYFFSENSSNHQNGNESADVACLYIHSIVVDKSYRRRGYGKLLLKEYCSHIAQSDSSISKICLLTHKNLIHFFKKCDFEVVGKNPGTNANASFYEMKLTLPFD